MKSVYVALTILSASVVIIGESYANSIHGNKQQRYFGEQPPGLNPKLFSPKILSPDGRFEGGNFNPDMSEYYFTRKNGKYKQRTFFVIRYEDGRWGEEQETNIRWPMFSVDGNTMFLGKQYREKTSTGWSAIKNLGEFIDEQAHGLSVAANGTLYFPFFKKEDNGHGNLGFSRLVNGKYEQPVKLNADINMGQYIAHPYIAPDESYLMWDVEREDGFGQADIYLSFKLKNGVWSSPINMGNSINTAAQESSPWVSYDGKYLFFTRGNWEVNDDGTKNYVGKRYWVDAKVIESLRPSE